MDTDEKRLAAWDQIPKLLNVHAQGLVASGSIRERFIMLELPLD